MNIDFSLATGADPWRDFGGDAWREQIDVRALQTQVVACGAKRDAAVGMRALLGVIVDGVAIARAVNEKPRQARLGEIASVQKTRDEGGGTDRRAQQVAQVSGQARFGEGAQHDLADGRRRQLVAKHRRTQAEVGGRQLRLTAGVQQLSEGAQAQDALQSCATRRRGRVV